MAKATFGGGCFWGVQPAFEKISGVTKATAGYEGGTMLNPTYEDVCRHTTGHAEVVKVDYDPVVVGFNTLLDVFWNSHNPTTMNRQGPDVGDQYRSVILYHDEEQREMAERSKQILDESGRWPTPVVTQIVPAAIFYPAEEHHQDYLAKQGLASCHA